MREVDPEPPIPKHPPPYRVIRNETLVRIAQDRNSAAEAAELNRKLYPNCYIWVE